MFGKLGLVAVFTSQLSVVVLDNFSCRGIRSAVQKIYRYSPVCNNTHQWAASVCLRFMVQRQSDERSWRVDEG